MKNLNRYSALFFLFVLFANSACTSTNIREVKDTSRLTLPEVDTTRIVIRFNDLTQQEIKELVDNLPVKQDEQHIERCQCGDPGIVQLIWDYDNFSPADIQRARNSLTGRRGSAQGDSPFTFSLPLVENDTYRLTNYDTFGKKRLMSALALPGLLANINSTDFMVNIAILDTGIDFYKNKDMDPFLYSTENLITGCEYQISGWNFVHHSKDVRDDHGHGTYVTRLITSVLEDKGVPYRILPIKVFNSQGKGDYWDIVCALSYVKEIQKKNENMHIVNASFGYSFFGTQISDEALKDYKEFSIAMELIDDIEQSTVFIASAGNSNRDIDVSKQENFPASFTSENLVGVGGYVFQDQTKATDGNYGHLSIDVAAPYTDYKFSFKNKFPLLFEKVTLTGSSYSSAFTTANIADVIFNQQDDNIVLPSTIKTEFYNSANNWVKIDSNLAPRISNGRFQEY